ncbi:integrase core domain-containing protein [Paracoccus sp. MC1862]|uniref:integrase core domain-containing protein n=1 Tax=Paracoccus sp. MC1862 TaxID=2760307 RepID=UPI00351C2115
MCPTTGRCESFTAKLRDERLTGDILCSLAAAKIVLAAGRRPCTTKRPHSSPGERPPAPEVPQGPPSPPGAACPATPSMAPGPVMHQVSHGMLQLIKGNRKPGHNILLTPNLKIFCGYYRPQRTIFTNIP